MLKLKYCIPQSIAASFIIAFTILRINSGDISFIDAFAINLNYYSLMLVSSLVA